MTDEMLTHDNVIAVTFPEEANAYEALARLKEQLDAQGDVDVPGAAVVAREEDGKISIKDQFGKESYENTAGGGLLGLLVGVLGGPLGVLVGGATGLVIGSLFDEDDDDHTQSVLGDLSSSIRVDPRPPRRGVRAGSRGGRRGHGPSQWDGGPPIRHRRRA